MKHPKPYRSLSPTPGSRFYQAPEILLEEQHSEASDIFAAGCILTELLYSVKEPRAKQDGYWHFYKPLVDHPVITKFGPNQKPIIKKKSINLLMNIML